VVQTFDLHEAVTCDTMQQHQDDRAASSGMAKSQGKSVSDGQAPGHIDCSAGSSIAVAFKETFESWWTSSAKYNTMQNVFGTCSSIPASTLSLTVTSEIDMFTPDTTSRDVTVVVEYEPEQTISFSMLSAAAEQVRGVSFQSMYCGCESTVTIVSVATTYNMADARKLGEECSVTKGKRSDKSDNVSDSQASQYQRPVLAVTVAAVVAIVAFTIAVMHRRATARRAAIRVMPFNGPT
jgi:hypothetical protein